MYKHENGYFLVRRTQRDENILVLSLMCNAEFFNYEICVKDYALGNKYYFIDDGPYFKSLPNLIEHYTKYEDGLPGILTKSIHSSLFSNGANNGMSNMNSMGSVNKQPKHFLSSSLSNSSSTSNSSTTSGPLNQIQLNMNQINGNAGSFGSDSSFTHIKSSDALTRANLFKSRTLLNDQSIMIFYRLFKR